MEDLRFLSRETGRSVVSFTPPLSRDELSLFLAEINEETLSSSARDAYNRIEKAFFINPLFSDGVFSLSAHPEAALEGRVRTNSAIPWSTKEDAESPPLISLPMAMFFADTLTLYFEPRFSTDPSFYEGAGSTWGINVPSQAEQIDMNMPLRAFAAAGGGWWNFQLGRDRVSFGTGRTGNLSISDTPDYYDFLRFSLFSPNTKYSIFISQIPLSLSGLLAESAAEPSVDDLWETTQRYIYTHRLDLRLFRRLSLGITEAVIIGNSPPELRYLNPLALFHSFFAWNDYEQWGPQSGDMAGSLLSLEFNWTVFPSLAFYGQFVVNEYATSYELEHWPDNQAPNGLGYLGGFEYVHDFGGWGASFFSEVVYTDPYLYILASPFASYLWMRRLSDLTFKELRFRWLGHPEGRDAFLWVLGSSWVKAPFRLSLDFSLLTKGERSVLLWEWGKGIDFNQVRSPSGIPENQYTGTMGIEWKPLAFMTLSWQISGIMLFNANNDIKADEYGIETFLSAKFAF
jgi:hypothetical protein